MVKHLLIFFLALTAVAGDRFVGLRGIASGRRLVSPQHQYIYGDVFLTMEDGAEGERITTTMATNSTYRWSLPQDVGWFLYGGTSPVTNMGVVLDNQAQVTNVLVYLGTNLVGGDGTRCWASTNLNWSNYVQITFGGPIRSNVCIGGWMKLGNHEISTFWIDPLKLDGNGEFIIPQVTDSPSGPEIHIHCQTSNGPPVYVDKDTWYHLAIRYTASNYNCLMRVSDTSGNLVGTSTGISSNFGVTRFSIGRVDYHENSITNTEFWFDNWVIDYADDSPSRFPCGPFANFTPSYSNNIAYLLEENFEDGTTGYDDSNANGWTTNGAGTAVWPTYTTNVLAGTQSLALNQIGNANGVRASFTASASVWVYMIIRMESLFTASGYLFTLRDADGNIQQGLDSYTATKAFRFLNQTGNSVGTGLADAGVNLHVWMSYTKGTGANGITRVFISNNAVRPAVAAHSWACTGTADVSMLEIGGQGYRGGWGPVVDTIRVSTQEIGSKPR